MFDAFLGAIGLVRESEHLTLVRGLELKLSRTVVELSDANVELTALRARVKALDADTATLAARRAAWVEAARSGLVNVVEGRAA